MSAGRATQLCARAEALPAAERAPVRTRQCKVESRYDNGARARSEQDRRAAGELEDDGSHAAPKSGADQAEREDDPAAPGVATPDQWHEQGERAGHAEADDPSTLAGHEMAARSEVARVEEHSAAGSISSVGVARRFYGGEPEREGSAKKQGPDDRKYE